jgi:hypothetical protein
VEISPFAGNRLAQPVMETEVGSRTGTSPTRGAGSEWEGYRERRYAARIGTIEQGFPGKASAWFPSLLETDWRAEEALHAMPVEAGDLFPRSSSSDDQESGLNTICFLRL